MPRDIRWTRQLVLDRVALFVSETGRAPSVIDFNRTVAERMGDDRAVERITRLDLPSEGTVNRIFGSWNQMLEDAGLPILIRGKKIPVVRGVIGEAPDDDEADAAT